MRIKCFRDLKVWQMGKSIVVDVYQLIKKLPSEERFSLSDQIRRSAVSIPSNIAEGFNRFNNAEYRRFLYIALGSCAELETQLEIAVDVGHVLHKDIDPILKKVTHESKMLTQLIKKL